MVSKSYIQNLFLTALIINTCLFASCTTTKIVTENDCADAVNINKPRTVYHYFWGLKQAADIKPGCDPRYNHLNSVVIKTSLGQILLSVVTLGIVVPQKLSWCCAPYNPTPGPVLGKKP